MEKQTLVLCKLKKGNSIKYAWVDEKIAKFGNPIQIKNLDTKTCDRGWWIIRVKRDMKKHEEVMIPDDSEGISSGKELSLAT